jgi:hypothetical protein
MTKDFGEVASSDKCEMIRITPEMYRAGVAAFLAWNHEDQEIECLVASMFYSMLDERMGIRTPQSPGE